MNDGAPSVGEEWGGRFLALVVREHCSLPIGAWGYFFPVCVAVWRLADAMAGGRLGPVRAVWVDKAAAVPSEVEVSGDTYMVRRATARSDVSEGPGFYGAGGSWLMEQMQGDMLGAVDRLAWAVLAAVDHGKAESGRLRPSDIGPIDPALVTAVVSLTRRAVESQGLMVG